jgi:hypothetical protein
MPAITDSLLRTFGGLTLPAESSALTEQGLSSLDPGRDKLLALFASAINSEFGELWEAAVATLPSTHHLYDTDPVRDTLPDEPSLELMTQRKAGFPLLALCRDGDAAFEDYTTEKDKLTQQWQLYYVLGPLDVMDRRKLADILQAVPKLVALVIRKRGHASYESGALQFFGGNGDFAAVRLVSYAAGEAPFAENAHWTLCRMTLETVEISGWREGAFGDLEAADYTMGVGGIDEGIQPALVIGSSDEQGES